MPADNFNHKRKPFGGQSANIINDSEYEANGERTNGFQKSTPIHSDVVNTALKQASFVTCAVLEGLKNNAVSGFDKETTIDSTTEYPDVVSDVKTLLSKQDVEQAGNVSKTINGKAITSIFEGDGVTAKKAIKAVEDDLGNNIVNTYVQNSREETFNENITFKKNITANVRTANGVVVHNAVIQDKEAYFGESGVTGTILATFGNVITTDVVLPSNYSKVVSLHPLGKKPLIFSYNNSSVTCPIFPEGTYTVSRQLHLKAWKKKSANSCTKSDLDGLVKATDSHNFPLIIINDNNDGISLKFFKPTFTGTSSLGGVQLTNEIVYLWYLVDDANNVIAEA